MDIFDIEDLRYNILFKSVDFDSILFNRIKVNAFTLPQGELVYREGEKSTSVFLIVYGEINLIPSQFNSSNSSVVYSKDNFFGASEFVSNLPRGESAIAISDSYLVELSKDAVDDLIKQSDEILSTIYSASDKKDSIFNSEQTDIAKSIDIEDSSVLDSPTPTNISEVEKLLSPNVEEVNANLEGNSLPIEKQSNTQYKTEMTFEQLDRINKAAHLVNSNVKIDDVLRNIVDVSVSLCEADRGTLYLIDKSRNELWSKVLQGDEPRKITLKMGNGFAGWAAEHKELVNVENASLDERFNDEFDKSSGYKTVSVLCFPIKNKNDSVVGIIQLLNSKKGAFTKLDENFLYALSTNAALALQNADLVEQLLKTERISSLGKMANFLIEDIKKPILVSKRYTEHLKKKNLSADVVNVLDMLLEQLNSVADIVQSTSNYSEGKSVLESSNTSLNSMLDEFTERINSYVQSMKCNITGSYDADANVTLDTTEFYQGFKHIIKNACEAMPDGGKITISTKYYDDNITILIEDEGLGIPTGFNDKIFEPFMSYGKKAGTGLGLSVTKKIIEEHNGTISATSNSGLGTTIQITLPTV